MKYFIASILIASAFFLQAQALRDINYNYQYNPDEAFVFYMKPVRLSTGWQVFYKLITKDTSVNLNNIALTWEARSSVNEREGKELSEIKITETSRHKNDLGGFVQFGLEQSPKILVAKVIDTLSKTAWFSFRQLDLNYPVNNYVLQQFQPLFPLYHNSNQHLQIAGNNNWIVSYYNDDFPAASPPFSEAQGKVSKGMLADSTFVLPGSKSFELEKTGLYLLQQDTTSAEGFAFRVENDFPKFSRIASLVGPFIYICTKQEFDNLSTAKTDKKSFDKIILGITKDADRARSLMRTYFRRVELANRYFTSYKEGWKTDRGMIYIVFGLPDEVFRYDDREVWNYRNDQFRITYTFMKASSVYDPENYVLMRDKKYQQNWYQAIDIIRNARF